MMILLAALCAAFVGAVPTRCASNYVTPPGSTAQNYYVSTTGSNTADGLTVATAWKTIQYAANQMAGKTGVTVNVMAGVYAEQVTIAVTGTASAWVVFQGNGAKIDGSTLGNPCANCRGLVWLKDCQYTVFRGFEVSGYTSSSSSIDPTGIYISAEARTSKFVQVYENWINNIKTTGSTDAFNAHGLVAYGFYPITDLVISHNEVSNCILGFSESLTVDGDVSNFEISDNLVHDNNNIGILAAGWYGTARTGGFDSARQGVITRNIIYNCSSKTNPAYGGEYSADGMYCDGCTYVNFTNNIVFYVDIGIEIAAEIKLPANASNCRVEGNVFANNTVMGISTGGYDKNRGSSNNNVFANNLLYRNDVLNDGNGEMMFQCYVYNATLFNNTIVSRSTTITSGCTNPTKPSYSGNTADADKYHASFDVTWVNGQSYSTIAAFRSGASQEATGTFTSGAAQPICSYTSQCVAGELQPICPTPTTAAPTTSGGTSAPTAAPTTKAPATSAPTSATTSAPTSATTSAPTTKAPTTKAPTTKAPTLAPTTKAPTNAPTTKAPTRTPTRTPTRAPTRTPTRTPTRAPTKAPTVKGAAAEGIPQQSIVTDASGATGQHTAMGLVSMVVCSALFFVAH